MTYICEMNAREQLEACANWLGYQDENMSFGLRSPEDGLKLWRYAQTREDLDEFADNWNAADRILAIGYCPFMSEEEDALLEEAAEEF